MKWWYYIHTMCSIIIKLWRMYVNLKCTSLKFTKWCHLRLNKTISITWPAHFALIHWIYILHSTFTILYDIFRPLFINGRPQDSDSVFGRKKALVPFFESQSPPFFHLHHFHSHHLSGVTRSRVRPISFFSYRPIPISTDKSHFSNRPIR